MQGASQMLGSERSANSTRTPRTRPAPEQFARERYAVWKSALDHTSCRHLCQHALQMAEKGQVSMADRQVPNTPSLYGDAAMDRLLRKLLKPIERATALRLYPTYSYFRVYKRGDVLHAHRDREACEISLSLSLGYDAPRPWPLWIDGPAGAVPVSLEPGDGVLYRGIECAHWRNVFRGRWAVQVFLHYVDRDGPHAQWKFDRRPRLGVSGIHRRL